MSSENAETVADPPVHLWLGMSAVQVRRVQWFRKVRDIGARGIIKVGGVGVIGAVALIFLYLLLQILPLFKSASLSEPVYLQAVQNSDASAGEVSQRLGASQGLDISSASLFSVEEQFEVAMALFLGSDSARVDFHRLDVPFGEEAQLDRDTSGQGSHRFIRSVYLPQDPAGSGSQSKPFAVESTSFAALRLAGLVHRDSILFWRDQYEKTFSEGPLGELESEVVPQVVFPYSETYYQVVPAGESVVQAGLVHTTDALVVVSYTESGRLFVKQWSVEQDLFGDNSTLQERAVRELPAPTREPLKLLLEPALQWLYVATAQSIEVYDLLKFDRHQQVALAQPVEYVSFLLGDISLLIGDAQGQVSQWFMVRQDQVQGDETKSGAVPLSHRLQQIRTFKLGDAPIVDIQTEQRRKSFAVLDSDGRLGLFYSTAGIEVFNEAWFDAPPNHLAISPRGNYMLYDTQAGIAAVSVDNKHPEVSWSSLWQEIWYENYIEPEYIWQSSAANNDFEPKFSLTPLAFGTLKAAFYAMLFAVPLAVCAAIYTAYFMAPALRKKVKPTIEFMEALPTVILGFLAGLWLAPFVEQHLPGIFAMLLLLPVSFFAFGYLWSRLPKKLRTQVPDGWHPLLLVPLVMAVVLLSVHISAPLEALFFDGSVRNWLTNEVGIGFDQRNALVVGIAMGFAVIPTIYSIAEDAIFAVPKNLSFGSLALGATPWQTLVRVILPTASPGIFSALMIGFGRAVGETMIVLMATGNTPIMDINIFEGLRTLSANIAVEMPEAELQSTHYRLLFLAAFVLFVITFCFNTSAEVVRQRLREKYGSL